MKLANSKETFDRLFCVFVWLLERISPSREDSIDFWLQDKRDILGKITRLPLFVSCTANAWQPI